MILLKRIVALPGEQVEVRGGSVLVNGTVLQERYVRGNAVPSMRNVVVLKDDEYFVIGDNRDVSAYGVVRSHMIQGKVIF